MSAEISAKISAEVSAVLVGSAKSAESVGLAGSVGAVARPRY